MTSRLLELKDIWLYKWCEVNVEIVNIYIYKNKVIERDIQKSIVLLKYIVNCKTPEKP